MPRTPAPLRTVGVLLRALLGLALLLALIAGTPYLLLAVGHQPTELTGGLDLLMEQDDGTLFLVVLTCLGWAGWALFTFSALVELVAVLRRRSAPRIKGLGGIQSLASFLIGGIVLLAPTAASAATSTPAVAVSTVHVAQAGPASPAGAVAAAPADKSDWPQHTVGSVSELPWDLAEEYLGDGKRWKDIAALNPDIPQLAAGDQFLPKGAVVKLPADARPTAPATDPVTMTGSTAEVAADDGTSRPAADSTRADATDSPEPSQPGTDEAPDSPRQYTVEAGDNLSAIAQEQLGDGDRWTDLYEENRGGEQPNGRTFTDPDLIYPGQELTLPHTGSAGTAPDAAPETSTPPRDRPTTPAPEADNEVPEATEQDRQAQDSEPDRAAAVPEPSRTAEPASPAPAPSTAAPSAGSAASQAPTTSSTAPAAASPAGDDGQEPAGARIGVIGLAATGVLAAGILSTVATRRILQQRRRRPGRRIAMPQGQTARTETALRSADAGVELALLGAALRTAALRLAEEDRPLPDLAAVQLGAEGIRLHLAEPVPPCAPFTADPEQSTRWWCPAESDELLCDDELREVDAPYPGLVALGQDEEGAIVLVDLEHLGALHLTGSARIDVLRTLAVTLALSPLAGQLDLAIAGEDTAPGLSMLDGDRVTPYQDLAGAVEAMDRHHDEQQQVLKALGEQGTLGQARPSEDVGELWPLVVVADLDTCNATPEASEDLWERLGGPVRTAMAIITSSTSTPPDEVVWSVDTDAPDVTVPGTDVSVVLSACSTDEYADILELALTADSPTDVPAPEPSSGHRPVPEQHADGDEQHGPDTGVSGSAAHTAPHSAAGAGPEAVRRSPLAGLADLDDEAGPDEVSTEAVVESVAPRAKASPAAASSPSDVVLPAAASAPRVSARIPLPAEPAQPTEPAQDAAPLVRVLGPVEVQGAQGNVASNRRTLSLELTAWLALHPGATNHQIDEVLAPGGRVTRDTRNSRVGDVRRWLGADTDGNRYLPHVSTQPDKLYRLSDAVDCDWARFQQLVTRSHTTDGPEARDFLRQALDLVVGRPFSGIPPRRYVWAEPLVQDMISAIVDAADDLAAQYLEHGDGRGALWAATRGLDAAREVECLWRHRFRALALLGDDTGLETSIRQLEALLLDLGCTMSEETGETLQQLQATRH
ncbi:LysM peptidoglycan-binding domain-containing protein [Streptomyces anulatus]|uniref:LysM peptidoglycan-binding domain-containing protein n=1 Tax=Streptomyces anulatus TaxID=1892 RepID=UPI002F909182